MAFPHLVFKGHATANDFLIYQDPAGQANPTVQEVAQACDRHRGIGADGVIRLTRLQYVEDITATLRDTLAEQGVQWFMDYRNADGSIAEMCGNGSRLTAAFAQRVGIVGEDEEFLLGTRAGLKRLHSVPDAPEQLGTHVYAVSMGEWSASDVDAYQVTLVKENHSLPATFVNMGNPHVVAILSEDKTIADPKNYLQSLDLTVAPVVEPLLPAGQNVELVTLDSCDSVRNVGTASMRVYERGCGETQSCGTGLCATGITLYVKTGVSHWEITVPGGVLQVDVTDDDVTLVGDTCIIAAVQYSTL